ncbi:MAG: redox-sensing transcriptional repressor Rex [Candidatus Wallbacteria bacterium]
MNNIDFSLRIIERLPKYLQFAYDLKETGYKFISSSTLSNHFIIDQNNIKKDLSCLNINGRPNKGYEINEFIDAIKTVLGTRITNKAVVIGAGNLGTAVSNYSGFNGYGLEIVALFDIDISKINKTAGNRRVLPLDLLHETIKNHDISLAILAVPAKAANEIAIRLYDAGIRYFWNFAPVHVKLPDDAIIKNENLAADYMVLSYLINTKKNNGGNESMAIDEMEKRIDEALNNFAKSRENLIPILQEVQNIRGYISKEDICVISKYLNVPDSKVFGVATFYNQFKLNKPGVYQISVCRGTACHVKGSLNILNSLKDHLKVDIGETTKDGMFSLQQVACLGACSIAPVMMINDKFYGHLDVSKAIAVIDKIKSEHVNGSHSAEAHA